MNYALLTAALVLALMGCDQRREKSPGEGKPGQYPPSLWEKHEGQMSDADIEEAQKDDADLAPAPLSPPPHSIPDNKPSAAEGYALCIASGGSEATCAGMAAGSAIAGPADYKVVLGADASIKMPAPPVN